MTNIYPWPPCHDGQHVWTSTSNSSVMGVSMEGHYCMCGAMVIRDGNAVPATFTISHSSEMDEVKKRLERLEGLIDLIRKEG